MENINKNQFTKTNLLSLVLTLQPIASPLPTAGEQQPATTLWWGRAAHALLLNTIRSKDENLAAQLHDQDGGLRPFTVSSLMGRFPHGELDPQANYNLRFTAFEEMVATHLFAACQQAAGQPEGGLAPGATVELDYLPFQVMAVAWEPPAHSWAAATSYQELSAPYLLAQMTAEKRVSLEFTSPTTFKSDGKHIPIPLPELVFGSLLEKWNAFAPIAFPPETRRYAAECLAISRYKLESRSVGTKGYGLRMGGIGSVTYTCLNYDRYWMSLIHVLAEFAMFSGVGAGATMGLGQCRSFIT